MLALGVLDTLPSSDVRFYGQVSARLLCWHLEDVSLLTSQRRAFSCGISARCTFVYRRLPPVLLGS